MIPKIQVSNLNLYYSTFHALKNINVTLEAKKITAIIGPSGCGKSTLLRVFNRMNDLVDGVKTTGEVFIDGNNILATDTNLVDLRKKVGMVFQRPNPFPLSIYENVIFGLKVHGIKKNLDPVVENSLKAVSLWDGLKDRLKKSALSLTLEEKQRLCIARLIAVKSDIVLMDEPCSSLDPQSTTRIEELMRELKKEYSIVIVTHNMQQAARVSDDTGFMLLGELIEFNKTEVIFTKPHDSRTEGYITGRYG